MREILTVLASSSLFSGLTETEIQEIQQTLGFRFELFLCHIECHVLCRLALVLLEC